MHGVMSKTGGVAGIVDYLAWKLEAEASPFGLSQQMATAPGSVLVVDVRDHASFEREHIRGAVNIPAEDIATGRAHPSKDKPLVVYCWDLTCTLAPKAALVLARKGYDVRYLAGGLEEWRRKGYTLERELRGERRL
jgi:rhodanese-related sulfurtransferase